MPIRLCMQPQCAAPATYRGRCATHARAREKQTHGNKSIYNSKRWKVLRRAVLFDHPLCECGEIATDVDHIRPIEHDGDPWNRANLQAMCGSCHGKKTRREMGT